MASRTFNVKQPHMQGGDVKNWQQDLIKIAHQLKLPTPPLAVDGDYGAVSRSLTGAIAHAMGMHAHDVMAKGVTPTLRRRMREQDLTAEEKKRFRSSKYKEYRTKLRKRWAPAAVHPPVNKILADSWGYHPPVHDGLDVICPPDVPIFAMVKAKVIDVRTSGWWGKAPSGDVSRGDGIIQLEVLETVGPFRKGFHIGYGHAEKPKVKVGQIVQAGDPIGHAGLAVAWHVHLMYNDGTEALRGVGNRDPRPILDYSVKNG